jgi:hypothetical protein
MTPKEILEKVKIEGFCVVKNFADPATVISAKEEYLRSMEFLEIHSPKEKFSPEQLALAPWRKFAIGSRTGNGEAYSQILQTTYFSERDLKFPALVKLFNLMIELRNELTGMADDYGSNLATDHFWNACRVHHYPQGGGHMSAHRDTLFPKMLEKFELPFIQIMMTLSNRHADFNSGGGYIEKKNGERHFFEEADSCGSLVLFDGSTVHGVDDIDLDKVLSFDSTAGRIALFVNLYTNMALQ